MMFSAHRWAALALFSLLSLNQLDTAGASTAEGAVQHHADHARRHHADHQLREQAEERSRIAAMPVANKLKIQRFIKNVEGRYSKPAVQEDKWEPEPAKVHGLDTTVADSDNKVQGDIIRQLAGAIKTGMDHIGEGFAKLGSNRGTKMIKRQNVGAVVAIPLRDVVLAEDQDAEYLAQVMVGTPPVPYWLQADSGSVNGQRKLYSMANSSTYQPTPSKKSFELYYSQGGVRGVMVRENLAFGADLFGNGGIKIQSQTLGLARELSADFATDSTDGVLGLGFRALTAAGERTILQNLFAQNIVKSKIVSFYLGRKRSATQDRSEMRIGDTNQALFQGDIHYVPVTKKAYWSFNFGRFTVSGASKKKGVAGGKDGLEGVVDTGTSYIALPFGSATDFWSAVPGAQSVGAYNYWVYPCSNKLAVEFSLPDGTVFKLDPADLNAGKAYTGSTNCIGTVFSADTGNRAIFGASLLKSVYTVLDWGSNQIGFAQAV
ncbi:unnamed protein product [Tilletia controversa]|uniref:Uncharacterized protein n=2 Tax=Tilletia TaxID=13289 RepID=A0A9N8QBN9_9BASI|nr:unnamed protein product [Tilletia caries]CAD6899108.1 unnamed protein product [Tilletia controversa]CAD6922068.1 unnamed protein product [Tilletia laevis]CAD6913515.1 unnamed protein product [Tilletia caries]CAD6936138.1 unnamed protein product [Tilletia controversa]